MPVIFYLSGLGADYFKDRLQVHWVDDSNCLVHILLEGLGSGMALLAKTIEQFIWIVPWFAAPDVASVVNMKRFVIRSTPLAHELRSVHYPESTFLPLGMAQLLLVGSHLAGPHTLSRISA